jgi:hypothetical protein
MARSMSNVGKIAVAVIAAAYFFYYAQSTGTWHFIDNVNLIIHEAGHTIFSPFGDFIHILGGSLFQVLVPMVFSGYFFFRGQYYSGALSLYWVGQNLMNVSVYARDAIVMQLPLLGGDGVIHDWNYINVLPHTGQIAATIYGAGLGVMVIAFALSFYFSLIPDKFVRAAY